MLRISFEAPTLWDTIANVFLGKLCTFSQTVLRYWGCRKRERAVSAARLKLAKSRVVFLAVVSVGLFLCHGASSIDSSLVFTAFSRLIIQGGIAPININNHVAAEERVWVRMMILGAFWNAGSHCWRWPVYW